MRAFNDTPNRREILIALVTPWSSRERTWPQDCKENVNSILRFDESKSYLVLTQKNWLTDRRLIGLKPGTLHGKWHEFLSGSAAWTGQWIFIYKGNNWAWRNVRLSRLLMNTTNRAVGEVRPFEAFFFHFCHEFLFRPRDLSWSPEKRILERIAQLLFTLSKLGEK